MALSDELREQRAKLKGRPFKEKFSWFWHYYRVHTLVLVIILFAVGSTAYGIATQKDVVLTTYFLNSNTVVDSERISNEFIDYLGIDNTEYEIYFDPMLYLNFNSNDQNTMANAQKIVVTTSAGEVDLMAGDPEIINHYASNQFFSDLRDVLPESYLTKYQDAFLYCDLEDENGNKESVPIAINISAAPKIQEWACYPSQNAYLAFVVNGKHPDNSLKFLDYLFG